MRGGRETVGPTHKEVELAGKGRKLLGSKMNLSADENLLESRHDEA